MRGKEGVTKPGMDLGHGEKLGGRKQKCHKPSAEEAPKTAALQSRLPPRHGGLPGFMADARPNLWTAL